MLPRATRAARYGVMWVSKFPEATRADQEQFSTVALGAAVIVPDHNRNHGCKLPTQAGLGMALDHPGKVVPAVSGHGLHQAAAGGGVVVVVTGFFAQQHHKAKGSEAEECGGEGGDVKATADIHHLSEVASHVEP